MFIKILLCLKIILHTIALSVNSFLSDDSSQKFILSASSQTALQHPVFHNLSERSESRHGFRQQIRRRIFLRFLSVFLFRIACAFGYLTVIMPEVIESGIRLVMMLLKFNPFSDYPGRGFCLPLSGQMIQIFSDYIHIKLNFFSIF